VSPHVGTLSRLAVAAVLALLLVAPPEAHGAVVQLRTDGGAMAGDLQFTALPGEANLVTVELAGTGPLRVRDAGGGLIAGENCSGGGGEVVCAGLRSPATLNLDITLSDGDDRRRTARLGLTPTGRRVLRRRDTRATVILRGTGLPGLAWGILLARR
jgi:hypothetical protein